MKTLTNTGSKCEEIVLKKNKRKLLNRAIKATMPLMAMLGGSAVASTRSTSSVANSRMKNNAVVYVKAFDDKALDSKLIDTEQSAVKNNVTSTQDKAVTTKTKVAQNAQVKSKPRNPFAAFSNNKQKTTKAATIATNHKALAFLQNNGLLSAGKVNVANTSGNKVFAHALPFNNWSGGSFCSNPAYQRFYYTAGGVSTSCFLYDNSNNRVENGQSGAACQIIHEKCESAGASPEINIQGNGVNIADGDPTPNTTDHTDFGSHTAGGSNLVRTFTIQNTGTGVLDLTGAPNVAITGSSDFSVTTQPASDPISAAGSTTFQVTLDPTTVGTQNATIFIANDDSDESPYNFTITAAISAAIDTDGSLTAAAGVIEPIGLDTVTDTVGEAVDVFDFTLTDGGTADGNAMIVSQIVVNVTGTTTDAERVKVTWLLNGNDVSNVTGVYNASVNTVTFSGLGISVANGANEVYTVNAYYNDNTGITDGHTFILSIDGDTDLTVAANGTQMAATTAITNGIGGTFDVVATNVDFITSPGGAVSGVPFTTQPVVAAKDAAGNIDFDFNEDITIVNSPGIYPNGAGTVSNNVVAAVNGVSSFTSFTHTTVVDGNAVIFEADDESGVGSNLNSDTSNLVFIDVVATQLVFDTQPTPLSVNSGVSTNFTTVPVVSARDGNNIIDTDYSTSISITEVNGAGSAIMAVTGDTDGSGSSVTITPSSGVATFNGMQINYAASGVSSETFNLQASSGGLSTVNSSQLTGVVDSTSPMTTSINVPANGTYIAGQNLDFTVNFDENVTVNTTGGTPQLAITIGATTRQATYQSGSGSNALLFRYTIQTGDNDSDGIAIGSLAANGGTVRDAAGNNAMLTLNSVGSTAAVLIDAVAPATTSVTVPANATYVAGQNIDFTVNFDENVTVNTVGGTPQLAITVGATTRQAVYISGSGTGALLFRYTIQAGDSDSDGIATGSLAANGGTVRDAAGNNATLTLNSVGPTTAVLIDAVAPATTSVTVPANATYITGQSLDFTVNFDENVIVNTVGGSPQLSITVGATTRQATYISGSGSSVLLFRYTVQAGDSDTDGIAIGTLAANGGALRDSAGNNAALSLNSVGATIGVLVDAVAPATTSVTVPENATYVSGQNLDFTVNFNESATVNTIGGTPQLAITIGSTTRQATYLSGSGSSALLFRYTVQTGDSDRDGIAIGTLAANGGTIRDTSSNNANLTLNSVGATIGVLVDAAAPTVAEVTAVSTPSHDITPNVTISTTEAGTLSVGGSCGSSDEGLISSGNVTISLTQTDNSTALDEGTYSDCTIIVTDTAGNASTTVTLTSFTIDTTPTISGAKYDASTGVLYVSAGPMSAGDNISVNRFTLTGEGGTAHTLTSADVAAASNNHFLVTLNDEDKSVINLFMNKNGLRSTDTVAYNLAALDDWNNNVTLTDVEDSISPVVVSNVAVPKIVDANYDANTGVIAVTAMNLLLRSGDNNDIVANKFSLTAEGGIVYTLTDSENVEVFSGSAFSITLSATDKAELNKVMNKNGTSATDATVYNLAAAEDWLAGADTAVVIADITDNAIKVSNVSKPTISQASYDASTAKLIVTGTSYLTAAGSANDITANAFVFTGQGGATYALTDTANVDVVSATSFTLLLSATDKAAVNQIINKTGTLAIDGTAFNLAANNGWNTGADESLDIVDATGNIITANVLNSAPVISGTPLVSIDQGYTYNFTPTASDFNEDDLSFSIVNQPMWASFDETTGELTGVPANGDVGSTSDIVITVSDGVLSDSLAAFELTVVNVNDAPIISGTPTTRVAQDGTYSFMPSASDIDFGSTLSFSITNQPMWSTFSAVTGALTGTPSNADVGITTGVVITVSDGQLSSSLAEFSITVSNINDAPVIGGMPVTQVNEGSVYSFTPTVTDVDEDDVHSFSISGHPDWMLFDEETGSVSGTPVQDDVDVTSNITIAVNDNSGAENATDSMSFSVVVNNVNQEPTAVADRFELVLNANNTYILDVLSNDVDIDGDTLVITGATASIGSVTHDGENLTVITQAGFVGEMKLLYTITDGSEAFIDGTVVLLISGELDALVPTITAPENVEVNATGLYTKVNLGVATAVNSDGKSLPVSLINSNTLFKPGNHIVYWQATDTMGLTSVASQQVAVNPLISLSKNQIVVEGKTALVNVILNGEAPNYPVTVTLNIAGNADDSDYVMASNEVIISSGKQAQLMVDIIQDNKTEGDETLTLSLSNGNVGSKSSHAITIVERNIAPAISLVSTQNNESRQVVTSTDGLVTVQAIISDANDDNVSSVWSYDSALNINQVDDNTLELDPSGLSVGVYRLGITSTDDGMGNLATTKSLYLAVVASLAELTDIDTDGDRIPDNEEGYGDADQDGIPDFQDAIAECNVMPEQASIQDTFLVEGEPGICLRKGNTLAAGETGGLQLTNNDLENSIGTDNEAVFVGGVFDYIVTGLPEAGQTYQIVLPQLQPIPAGAVYRKYSESAGWGLFVEDANNQLHSAAGTQGYCPPPASTLWTSGLTAGHWCVQLTLEDGGPNDNDGISNGTIVDPGGVSVLITDNALPVAQVDSVRVKRDQAIVIDVLANDTDADQDTLTLGVASANFGVVSITADNKLAYQSATNFVGQDTVAYSLSDGNGGTASSTVDITVYVNDAPVALDDTTSTDDRSAIVIDVLANDTDADGESLVVVSAIVDNGDVVINEDNTLTYTPVSGFDGTALITYIVEDGQGDQASAQVSVTVKAFQSVTVKNESKGGSMGLMIIVLAGVVLYRSRRKRSLVNKHIMQGAAALVVATSMNAAAAEPQWFVTGSIGKSQVSESISTPSDMGITSRDVDKSDASYSFGGGVKYDAFAFTVSYEQLGEASATFSGDTLAANAFHQALAKSAPKLVDGISFQGQYTFWQSGMIQASVGLGLLAWELDYTSKLNDSVIEMDEGDIDLFYNLALGYTLTEQVEVSLKVSRYNLSVNDVNNIALGVTYHF